MQIRAYPHEMSTGPKQRPGTTQRGGARPGAGRPATFGISERELNKLFKALKKEAKERGQSWQANFAKHLFAEDWHEAAAFHRMLTDQIKVNRNVQETPKEEKKPVALPALGVDPGKVVPIKSEKAG